MGTLIIRYITDFAQHKVFSDFALLHNEACIADDGETEIATMMLCRNFAAANCWR